MTSTIAVVALFHAIPILLTAYIARSKTSVRTAAAINIHADNARNSMKTLMTHTLI